MSDYCPIPRYSVYSGEFRAEIMTAIETHFNELEFNDYFYFLHASEPEQLKVVKEIVTFHIERVFPSAFMVMVDYEHQIYEQFIAQRWSIYKTYPNVNTHLSSS